MIDKFICKLYEQISMTEVNALEISDGVDECQLSKDTKFISLDCFRIAINMAKQQLEAEQHQKEYQEQLRKPYSKFLFVEDGSIDVDNLIEEMETKNPEIKVVVYRNGAARPELLDMASKDGKEELWKKN